MKIVRLRTRQPWAGANSYRLMMAGMIVHTFGVKIVRPEPMKVSGA